MKGLSQLSEHLLRDIGISNSDVASLNSGLISLDDLSVRRIKKGIVQQTISGRATATFDTRILDIECANEESFELGKCG